MVYNTDVTSLLQDGLQKILQGLTSLEELLKLIELDDDNDTTSKNLSNALEQARIVRENGEQINKNVSQVQPRPTIVPNQTQRPLNTQAPKSDFIF